MCPKGWTFTHKKKKKKKKEVVCGRMKQFQQKVKLFLWERFFPCSVLNQWSWFSDIHFLRWRPALQFYSDARGRVPFSIFTFHCGKCFTTPNNGVLSCPKWIVFSFQLQENDFTVEKCYGKLLPTRSAFIICGKWKWCPIETFYVAWTFVGHLRFINVDA